MSRTVANSSKQRNISELFGSPSMLPDAQAVSAELQVRIRTAADSLESNSQCARVKSYDPER